MGNILHCYILEKKKKKKCYNSLNFIIIHLLFANEYASTTNLLWSVFADWNMNHEADQQLSASDEKQAKVFLEGKNSTKSVNALGVPVVLGFRLNDE